MRWFGMYITTHLSKKISYDYMIIQDIYGILCMTIGTDKTPKHKQNHHNKLKCKKDLLEFYCGIYRMFPCYKNHRLTMQFLHLKDERRI